MQERILVREERRIERKREDKMRPSLVAVQCVCVCVRHPDKNNAPEAIERFRLIATAYEVMSLFSLLAL